LPDFPLTFVEEYIQFNQNLGNDRQIRKYFVSAFQLKKYGDSRFPMTRRRKG